MKGTVCVYVCVYYNTFCYHIRIKDYLLESVS